MEKHADLNLALLNSDLLTCGSLIDEEILSFHDDDFIANNTLHSSAGTSTQFVGGGVLPYLGKPIQNEFPPFPVSVISSFSPKEGLSSKDDIILPVQRTCDTESVMVHVDPTNTIEEGLLRDDLFRSDEWGVDFQGLGYEDLEVDIPSTQEQLGITEPHKVTCVDRLSSANALQKSDIQRFDFRDIFESQLPGMTSASRSVVSPAKIPSLIDPGSLKRRKTTRRKRYCSPQSFDPPDKVYVDPNDEDVLLGRGGLTNNHPGNMRYLEEKRLLQSRYLAASKEDKTAISQELVDIVHRRGGRFLKKDDNREMERWFEVLNIVARKKASQALREVQAANNIM